ncbi:WG repeat-containing protein [Psychrobacter sp. FDAARGOS_221]|uniref:WG repeat-containing protein n=1 Tax=Psychrobacter sp. FDAARGOS_221 TaxID=1975705 RepID=UPI00187D3A56|nr:WG repeat-containing protein [Psychrobacter sp. FDAARGOS_221]
MKPVYLALSLSIAALMGCSNNDGNTNPVSASDGDKPQQASADDSKQYEPCVIPEVEGYQQVGCLRDGLAGVIGFNEADPYTMSNRVGYIDENGKVIIPFEYDAIMTGEGGEALTFNDFSEGLVAVVKNDKYGFIDSKGEVVVPLQYEWASNFSDGLAVVRDNELYGAIDKTGKVVIPIEYASLGDFNDGFAAAARPAQDMNYQYGLIDKDNKEVIPFMYEQMGRFSEGLVAVQKEGKWGYVDPSNKPVIAIDLDYEEVNDFSSGLAAVFSYKENSDNMKYGYIDKTGELVIPMNFTRIFWQDSEGKIDFKNGYAIVNGDDDEEFCIDTKGEKAECPEGIDSTHWYSGNDEYAAADVMAEEQVGADTGAVDIHTQPVLDTLNKMRNVDWTWDNFAALPDTKGLEQDYENPNNYKMVQTVVEGDPETTVTFYGSQQRPEAAVIETRRWGGEDAYARLDTLSGNVILSSNCNFKQVSVSEKHQDPDGNEYEEGGYLEFQQTYLLPKGMQVIGAAHKDLYMASLQASSYVVTGSYQEQGYTKSIITPNKNKLGQYMNHYGWNTDKNGNNISCRVD